MIVDPVTTARLIAACYAWPVYVRQQQTPLFESYGYRTKPQRSM